MTVALKHRVIEFAGRGKRPGPPLVVLHGLLGSSRSWQVVGRALAQDRTVYLVDLRNHGDSPHVDASNYEEQAGDLLRWLDDVGFLERVDLLGHSMGGKVAMRLACQTPARLRRLVVVDIVPNNYPSGSRELSAMAELDLSKITKRSDAMDALAEAIPDEVDRMFLLTNLARTEEDGYQWTVHVKELLRGLPEIRGTPLDAGHKFIGPTAFLLAGDKSDFVSRDDVPLIYQHFPNAKVEWFEDSGHNVHVEARDEFVASVRKFLA